MVRLKRAYEPADRGDGRRILVDRLWPRGLSKEQAQFDEWPKEVAPSDSLRKWFQHDPRRWGEFEQRYARELDSETADAAIDRIAQRAANGPVTLVFSAHDEEHNNAVALKTIIERRLRPRRARKAARPAHA